MHRSAASVWGRQTRVSQSNRVIGLHYPYTLSLTVSPYLLIYAFDIGRRHAACGGLQCDYNIGATWRIQCINVYGAVDAFCRYRHFSNLIKGKVKVRGV